MGWQRLLLVLLPLASAKYTDLTNITEAVFGSARENRTFLPAAFGDFNSDKLTDMVVLRDNRRSVTVLLASQQKVVSSGDDPPLFSPSTSAPVECNAREGQFVSAAPADFDGDGGMDLAMVTRDKAGELAVWVYWGTRGALDCKASLQVILRLDNVTLEVASEPLVLDYNRDFISDLLVVTKDGRRMVVIFNPKGSEEPFTLEQLNSHNHTEQLKKEHSSAFIDVSGDGSADLLLTTQAGLELYSGAAATGLAFHALVPWPELGAACTVDQCIGQAVFADFNLDGRLDLLLPVCGDPQCRNSTLVQVVLSRLWHQGEQVAWQGMTLDLGPYRFLPSDAASSPVRLLAPRVGDVDLDGWPDLLVTMYNTSVGAAAATAETQLLLSVPCGELSACRPYWRKFQVQPGYTRGTAHAAAAAFFDLYEDGKLDIIMVDADATTVTAWTNTTLDSDAYFIKVIVLSGVCYHNCKDHSTSYVPYGTNSGGMTVSYTSQRAGPEQFASYSSVSAQMAQSAHFALQLPYTIFGLGLAPNFVDYMWVNTTAQRSHVWPQIIPNSQLYVIPYPPDRPDMWDAKLIIFTSKNIVITGLSMVGLCALVSCIIVGLHLRERRQDHQAKLQEAHRFHFDAM